MLKSCGLSADRNNCSLPFDSSDNRYKVTIDENYRTISYLTINVCMYANIYIYLYNSMIFLQDVTALTSLRYSGHFLLVWAQGIKIRGFPSLFVWKLIYKSIFVEANLPKKSAKPLTSGSEPG